MREPRAKQPIMHIPVDLNPLLAQRNNLVPPKLPLQMLHMDHHLPVDLHHHLRVQLPAGVAAPALYADLVASPLLAEPRPRGEPLPSEHVLVLGNERRVDCRMAAACALVYYFLLLIAQREDYLAVGDDCDVVVGAGLRLAAELGAAEVPEDLDEVTLHVEFLRPLLPPEAPRLELDLAAGCGAVGGSFAGGGRRGLDGYGEAVEEEIAAPGDGDEAAVAGDLGAVDGRDGALAGLCGGERGSRVGGGKAGGDGERVMDGHGV